MAPSSTRISCVIQTEKRHRLCGLAQATGKNLSGVVNEALDYYLALHEWQVRHIEQGLTAAKNNDFVDEKDVELFFKDYGLSTPE